MPIYDYDGTTKTEIGTIYDNDGTVKTQIGYVYDYDGTTKSLIFGGNPLSGVAVGSIVYLTEGGAYKPFYVAQHGYPTSGNGRTLLLRQNVYKVDSWDSQDHNTYATTDGDAWLNGTYLGLLGATEQANIAPVSIPYTPMGGDTSVSMLNRKIFLLSMAEFGFGANAYRNQEGTALAILPTVYIQIAKDDSGTAVTQFTRSPEITSTSNVWVLGTAGQAQDDPTGNPQGIRPALTLPSSISVNSNNQII